MSEIGRRVSIARFWRIRKASDSLRPLPKLWRAGRHCFSYCLWGSRKYDAFQTLLRIYGGLSGRADTRVFMIAGFVPANGLPTTQQRMWNETSGTC